MRRQIPSTAALVAFDAAARHVSYTAAADELALTQSAVCRQVANLEEMLGTALFRRSRRGVVLTDAGREYHGKIRRRLDEIERDTIDLAAHRGRGGTLNVAVVPTFGSTWLIPRIPAFLAAHPDCVLNLSSRTRQFLFDETEEDCAIYSGDGSWAGAVTTFVMTERLVPVCSPGLVAPRKRVSPAQLAKLPLLQQTTRPYAWRQWFESVGQAIGDELAGPRYELFSMSLQAAIAGMGVALVPDYSAERHLQAGELIVPYPHSFTDGRSYYLAVPDGKQGPVLERFRSWLLEQAHAHTASANAAIAAQ
jgi:DNA-binding transcriptional LysR family regulator